MSSAPARATFQRQRKKQDHQNNSLRRIYNLLHFSLPRLDPDTSLSEEALVASCSASRNTVRAVLRRLADEGLVSRRTNLGTRSSRWMVLPVGEAMRLDEMTAVTGEALRSTVLEAVVIPAPAIIRERLALEEGDLVLVIDGMLHLDEGLPLALSVSYITIDDPAQAAPLPIDVDPVGFVETELGVEIGQSSATLGAMTAGPTTAQTMGVPEGGALIWMEDVLADTAGRPRALTQYRFRGDRIAVSSPVGRGVQQVLPSA